MKLYHGSPQKLDKLVPQKAKGQTEFENLNAIYFVDSFKYAALYAIAKTLKGITSFGVKDNKVVVLGNCLSKLKPGYVYEVEINSPIIGNNGQYAILSTIIPNKITKVLPIDYKKYFIIVNTKDELFKYFK